MKSANSEIIYSGWQIEGLVEHEDLVTGPSIFDREPHRTALMVAIQELTADLTIRGISLEEQRALIGAKALTNACAGYLITYQTPFLIDDVSFSEEKVRAAIISIEELFSTQSGKLLGHMSSAISKSRAKYNLGLYDVLDSEVSIDMAPVSIEALRIALTAHCLMCLLISRTLPTILSNSVNSKLIRDVLGDTKRQYQAKFNDLLQTYQ